METTKIDKGSYLITSGDTIRKIYILVQGKMLMETKNDSFVLQSGSILGLPDASRDCYSNNYVAIEDSTVVSYPFNSVSDYKAIFEETPQYQYAFVHGAIMQCAQLIERYEIVAAQVRECIDRGSFLEREYLELCEKHDLSPQTSKFSNLVKTVVFTEEVEEWERQYNKAFATKDTDLIKEMYATDMELCIGEVQHASMVMRRAIHFMEEGIEYILSGRRYIMGYDRKDYFQYLFDARKQMAEKGMDQSEVFAIMERLKEFVRTSKVGEVLTFDQDLVEERIKEYEEFDFEALFTGGFEESEMADTDIGFFQDVVETYELEQEEEDEEDESADCLATILEYVDKSEEEIAQIREKITAFRELHDIYATDDDTRRLRRDLTEMFFDVYEKAFFRSLVEDESEESMDEIMKMFFNFGFMDVQLVGEENANILYELTDKLYACNSAHVFTIYSWLKLIAKGERQPSRNEFDLDYSQDLREKLKTGELTKEQVKEMEEDTEAKIRFEIRNMFKYNNRTTYGRITTYCPIIREEEFIKSPEELLVTVNKLGEAMNNIRNIDFGCFYRDTMLSDEGKDLPRMEIKVEIIPDIILLPNCGSRAMMWQETGGVKRTTPARFMFPIFTAADINDMMVETCGRYRWEICRKVQGMRWNDIRERSLTSEYCDYLQFYRKNHELTSEAKEKVKNALQKSKNNYREVFVRDYIAWIKFEAKGSVRLNKVARDIIFRYCPFGKGRRRFLKDSPMYHDMLEKYDIINQRNLEHVASIFSKYEKNGGEILPDMQNYLDFFEL